MLVAVCVSVAKYDEQLSGCRRMASIGARLRIDWRLLWVQFWVQLCHPDMDKSFSFFLSLWPCYCHLTLGPLITWPRLLASTSSSLQRWIMPARPLPPLLTPSLGDTSSFSYFFWSTTQELSSPSLIWACPSKFMSTPVCSSSSHWRLTPTRGATAAAALLLRF